MTLSLNRIQSTFTRHKFFIIAFLIVVLLLGFIVAQQIIRLSKHTYTPPPSTEQPVTNGKIDTNAPQVQQSKNNLEILKPKLPYDSQIITSTGTNVGFRVYAKLPDDPYTLYVSTTGINFDIKKDAPNYAQTVQDFRDTADAIFGFITQNGVNPSTTYIVWADYFNQQKTAESWLNVSQEYPQVIKQRGKYIFKAQ